MAGALQRAAGALLALGARVRTERVKSLRGALSLFLAELSAANTTTFGQMLGDDGEPVRMRDALRRGSPHTSPRRSSSLRAHPAPAPAGHRTPARGGAPAHREIEERIGDGVLLYPPYPWVAPRHR